MTSPHPQARIGEMTESLGGETFTTASDGTMLATRVLGKRSSKVALVFAHGFTLQMASWYFQADDLRNYADVAEAKMVFYDQRGHGDSSLSDKSSCNIDQLGLDLRSVIDAHTDSDCKVILVGHSMGGMCIMSYARQFPDEIGSRIASTVLVSTSPDRPDGFGLNIALNGKALRLIGALSSSPSTKAIDWVRRLSLKTQIRAVSSTHQVFGKRFVDAATFAVQMIDRIPSGTAMSFARMFHELDEHSALDTLSSIPVSIVCGTDDNVTSFKNVAKMTMRLSDTHIVSLPRTGHMSLVERHKEVSAEIARVLHSVTKHCAWMNCESDLMRKSTDLRPMKHQAIRMVATG